MENNIKKRETFSIYEDGERRFQLNAYDPIEGNYILIQLFNFVLPFGIGDSLSKSLGSETSLPSMGSDKMMPKEDFVNLQKDILKTIEEVYESGNKSPVLRQNGTYGVADVSMGLIIKLIIASLAFNFKDFFEEVPSLKEFIGSQDL